MNDFDIQIFNQFHLTNFQCGKCRALLDIDAVHIDNGYDLNPDDWDRVAGRCPVCNVEYVTEREEPSLDKKDALRQYAKSDLSVWEYKYADDKLWNHARNLADISLGVKPVAIEEVRYFATLRTLFFAIIAAKKFIHFTTYGLSQTLYGALRLKSQEIEIRGIASHIYPKFAEKIKKDASTGECDSLELIIYEQSDDPMEWQNSPHQKMIVIDGLLAFKGSANMTEEAWRKAGRGLELVESVTKVREVAELNNKCFSPIWAKHSEFGTRINLPRYRRS